VPVVWLAAVIMQVVAVETFMVPNITVVHMRAGCIIVVEEVEGILEEVEVSVTTMAAEEVPRIWRI
jgi:hypothetical protein